MDTERLSKWADLLLDTGKRNNLINFKDSKQGTIEIVAPDFNILFEKAEHSAVFEVYDPRIDSDEDDVDADEYDEQQELQSKQSYITSSRTARRAGSWWWSRRARRTEPYGIAHNHSHSQ